MNITDILTEALRASSFEKTEAIMKKFPDIPLTDSLKEAIYTTADRCLDLLMAARPEIIGMFNSIEIFDSWNDTRQAQPRRTPRLMHLYRCHYGEMGRWGFYKLALEQVKDAEKRRELLYTMFSARRRQFFSEERDKASGGPQWRQIFMKYQSCIEDFTRYLCELSYDREEPRRFFLEELRRCCGIQRLPIDIYKFLGERKQVVREDEMARDIVNYTKPIRIEECKDDLSWRILNIDDDKLVDGAIEAGFITEKNARAFLNDIAKIRRKNAVRLMKLIKVTELGQKYLL